MTVEELQQLEIIDEKKLEDILNTVKTGDQLEIKEDGTVIIL